MSALASATTEPWCARTAYRSKLGLLEINMKIVRFHMINLSNGPQPCGIVGANAFARNLDFTLPMAQENKICGNRRQMNTRIHLLKPTGP